MSIYNVFNKGYESELAAWKTLLHEQQKITHLTSLLDLRNQLKLNLGDMLVGEPSQKDINAKFNQLPALRQQIVEQSSNLERLAASGAEIMLLHKHREALEDGLAKQFFFQSLIQDFGLQNDAVEYFNTEVRPAQDFADSLLSNYFQLVTERVKVLQQHYAHDHGQTKQQFNRGMLVAVLALLLLVGLVTWFVGRVRKKFEQHTTSLEKEVRARTLDLERSKNQAAQSVMELKSVLDSAPDGIFQVDRYGKIHSANLACESVFGYKQDELIGQSIFMLVSEQLTAFHKRKLRNFTIKDQEKVLQMGAGGRVQGRHKSGRTFALRIALGKIDSQSFSGFTLIVRDIDKFVKLDLENKNQKALLDTLWHANNQFMINKNIVEVADYLLGKLLKITRSQYGFIGEVLFDEKNNPYLKTHAVTSILSDKSLHVIDAQEVDHVNELRALDTLLGEGLKNKSIIISNDSANHNRAPGLPESPPSLDAFIAIPVFHGTKLVGFYGLANKPGGYSSEDVKFLTPFTQSYGVIIQFKRMQSEQARLNDELILKISETERANQAKSEFLSSMSHELRTPLNAVLGYTQLLMTSKQLTEMQADSLNEISVAGKHLLSLINDVLDLAKIEAGQVNLVMEKLDLAKLLKECEGSVLPMATEKQISLKFNTAEALSVIGDRVRLKQVILNLLSNAVKYNNEAGQVEVVVKSDGNLIKISILDTGVGIAEDKREKLFQPFNRLGYEGSAVEGTGIGLSITKNLMELMGGNIEYFARPSGGSNFTISLMADAGQSVLSDKNPDLSSLSGSHSKPESEIKRVLYVEDNPSNLKLMQAIFEHFPSIEFVHATTPSTSLKLAESGRFDLILLDINLPEMNGYELAEQLKNMPHLKHTLYFAVTANVFVSDRKKADSSGFNEFVSKPIDIAGFTALLDKYELI
ncbi:MAG: PAS domain S-box protein [Methyloprofundus sp.]|nr:PAS domain S-box protein [Methyloprofundus sp.]